MPIEIKELLIRAVVEPGRAAVTGAATGAARPAPAVPGSGPGVSGPGPSDQELDQNDRSAIVAACVKEVWRRLDTLRER